MMDPVAVSLGGVPGRAVFWAVTVAAFALFGLRVAALIRVFRRGRREDRLDRIGQRILHFARYVLGQKRVLNDPLIGTAHFVIFWGFVCYASTFGWNLMKGLFPFLPVPYADEIGPVALLLEGFAVLVLAGLTVSALRRAFFPPAYLKLSRDAVIILLLITLLMVSFLLGEGFSVAGDPHGASWRPLGKVLSAAFGAMSADRARAGVAWMWWLHMVTVLGFTAYLPYSKHAHLLVSPFNVFFGNLRPPGDLQAAGTGEDVMAGASRWEELTWRQLVGPFACAECGRCDRVCPALNSGYPLSPQDLFRNLKHHLLDTAVGKGNGKPEAAKDVPAAPPAPGGDAAKPAEGGKKPEEAARKLVGGDIPEAMVWSCTTCYACMERCAVMNEHVPLVVMLRRRLVSDGAVGEEMAGVLESLNRYGNSFNQSDRARAKWTQPLSPKVKDARKEPVDCLWFVGDYASYDPRVQEVTRTVARIFQKAGLDFGILYEGERNAGNDVRRVGEEGLFEVLREHNLKSLGKAQYKRLTTTDPHSYNTLKNEYPLQGTAVLHYTELLDQLIREGKLPLKKQLDGPATYHDPCYLGRYNGVYEAPRRVLAALGVRLQEMPRNRNLGYCCGAGGGRIWMGDVPGIKERPAENRIREAVALGVQTFVVACPKDIAMFRDAVKTTGLEGKVAVKDVAELVWEAMDGAQKEEAK